MSRAFLKSLVLKAVSRGLKSPEGQFGRVVELIHLRDLLRELNVNCVLDVGANVGQFASELRGIGYRERIISFEPIQREFAAMSRRFANDQKWMGYQLALGSEEKIAKINVQARSDLSSFLNYARREPDVQCQEVEIKRLDNLFPQLLQDIPSPRVFLKMDTQGFDVEVFKGSRGCLDSVVGLQSELSVKPIYENMPHYLEALAFYEASGFEMYNVSVVSRMFGKGLVELNCFMKRATARDSKGLDPKMAVYLKHLAAGT
jgi:FkbM family methyltransferase